MSLSRIIVAVVLAGVFAGRGPAQPPAAELMRVEQLQKTLAAVAEEVSPSVVAVRALRRFEAPHSSSRISTQPDGQRRLRRMFIPSIGSGVVIDRDGLILTNEHVVRGVEPDAIECVLSSGQRYKVRGITTDPRGDLAVLSIDARDLRPVRWGDAAGLRQGHFVIAMGNPFGMASDGDGQPAVSFGIVSALGQDLTQRLDPERYYGNLIQTDARINPGNSGGPLVNLRGEVVGITTAVSSRSGGSDGVGYAISICKTTRWIVDRLAEGREVEYGYLGVRLEERPRRGNGRSSGDVVVSSVEPNTAASTAGLKAGDVIRLFNKEPVTSADELVRLVAMAGVGTDVPVSISRNGQRLEFRVAPARRPELEHGVNIEPDFEWRAATFSVIDATTRARYILPDSLSGVVVSKVLAGSSADKAGLRPGDVISRLNGEPIRGLRQFRRLTGSLEGDATLILHGSPQRKIVLP